MAIRIFTLKNSCKIVADIFLNICCCFLLLLFSEKTRLDILCESSAKQTNMSSLIFSEKYLKNLNVICSVLRVNKHNPCMWLQYCTVYHLPEVMSFRQGINIYEYNMVYD